MTHVPQFSPTQERWCKIDTFPGYSVSDWGRVMNDRTGFYITPTTKPQGLLMVGLMKNCDDKRSVQCKRSLSLLVARAFVPAPINRPEFDTPIHLDGERSNNHYTNLAWRPLWFARKYMKQFVDGHATFNEPIEDVETGERYENSMHASTTLGILDIHIYLSMINNTYVFPTGQVFREAVSR